MSSILVLKNSTQEAKLIAEYNENAQSQDQVFFYKLEGQNATQWSMSYEECQVVYAQRDVDVTPNSSHSGCGVFTIARYSNWLYTLSLHPDAESFNEEIINLIGFALTGEKSAVSETA